MSTRDQKVNIFQKKFMTRDNFTDNFLDFLLKQSIDNFKTIYGKQGFFRGGVLSSSAADQFTVSTPCLSTNGLGNILDLDPSDATVAFENELGVSYSLGLKYVSLAKKTEVNVRTGQIEYSVFEDSIGDLQEPDSIVDQGSTLRVIVNSLTEAGVDNTGRLVRVFLKRALGQADAFFEGVVQYDGSDNFIETTNLLGQTAGLVNTTASDYQVFLSGPLVKRNTDLSLDPNIAFLGTVEGAGAGNTPSTFDQTGQRQLPTFVPEPGEGLLAQLLTLLEGGGTLTHDDSTLGQVDFSQDLTIRPLGTASQVIVSAGSVTLADDEVAFVQLPTPFSNQTLSIQTAPRDTVTLAEFDRFWIFHRTGSVINVRGGLQLEQGEQRQLEDIVIGNSVFFSNDDRIRFNETDNIFHFDADAGSDNADLAIGEKVFYGDPTSQNFTSYLNGLLSVLFNNLTQDASVLTGLFRSERDTGTDLAQTSKAPVDAENRYQRDIDGRMSWGDGTNPVDVTLLRDAVGFLSLLGSLRISNGLIHAGDLANNDLFRFVDGVTPQWEFLTDNTVRAIIDEIGNITASNNLVATFDVLAGQDVVATRDSLTGSATPYADAQGTVIPKSASLNEVADESIGRKLLKASPNTPADTLVNIAPSRITSADGSLVALPNGSTVTDYPGGTIDFATGTITGGGVNFAPQDFSGHANEWFKYAVSLLTDNTIQITPASDFGTTQANAPDPLLPSGAISSTVVSVQDDGSAGAGTILAITETNFTRLPAAGGSSSQSSGGGGAPIEPELGFEAAIIDDLTEIPGTPDSNIELSESNGSHNPDGLIRLSCDRSLTGTSGFVGGVDEVQRLTFGAVPDGGVYRLTHEGNETVDIAAGSNAAALIGFLEALPSIDVGTLNITGDESSGFVVTYTGTEGSFNQPELTVTSNSLFTQSAAGPETNELFRHSHSANDADFAPDPVSLTTTFLGSASITGGVLDTANGNGGARRGVGNPPNTLLDPKIGTIRFKMTPSFTGNNGFNVLCEVRDLFGGGDGIIIQHQPTNDITVQFFNPSGISQILMNFGDPGFQTGVEVELEMGYDVQTGGTRFFVDGVQLGSTDTQTIFRSTNYSSGFQLTLGSDINGNFSADATYDDLQTFSAIQHTSNFSGEIPRSLFIQNPVTLTPTTDTQGVSGDQSIALTANPSFTVAPGDILYSYDLNEFRRILTVTDQQNYIFDSPFSGDITAGSVMVSQAIWTTNLLSIGDNVEENRFLDLFGARDIDEVQFVYEDSVAAGDFISDLNKEARIVASASNEGALLDTAFPISNTFGEHQARPSFPGTINNYALQSNATKERLFVLFFCNPDNTSITDGANLIKYKINIYRSSDTELGGFVESGFIISDGTGANGISSISTIFDSGLGINVTEVTLDFTFVPAVSDGSVDGELEVIGEGLIIPRFYAGIDPAKTLYYTEIGNKRVRFSADLTGAINSIHVRKLRPGQGGSAPTGGAQVTGVEEVTSESELVNAIATVPPEKQIRIAGSFEVTAPIVVNKSNLQITGLHQGLTISTGVGFVGAEMFDIPAAIENVTLKNLTLTSSFDTADGILIRDTAKVNRIENCRIALPGTTSKSAIHVQGQENHILGNRIDCGGSTSSPGCILLGVTSSDNLVATNIVS